MTSDARFAFRTLVKSPTFTLTAVAALALGIGANTAIFSLVNQVLLNPPGVSNPERIVAVRAKYDKLNLKSIPVSAPDFADVQKSTQVIEYAAILGEGDYNYTAGNVPERLQGAGVSLKWFEVFGAKPYLGRVFRPEEDQPNANTVVVLSYATWTRLFGGDRGVLGRAIPLNGKTYRIIGVMGPELRWPGQVDLWVPLGLDKAQFTEPYRFNEGLFAAARLRPGVSLTQANAYVQILTDRVRNNGTQGGAYAKDSAWGMFLVPMTDFVAGDTRKPLLVLLGAVGVVLLIACTNIAGLMLARASGRLREIAVRVALGASRWRLLRQTVVESSLLAFAGAIGGVVLAYAGMRLLLLIAPENAATGLSARVDVLVLLFTGVLAVAAGLLFSLAPAWQISRTDPHETLKGVGRSATAGRERLHLRSTLVVCETALALVLLVGAGLLLRSLARLQEVSPGFDPSGIMTATLSLPRAQYTTPEKQIAFYRAVSGRLAKLPGATVASFGIPIPFSNDNSSASFNIEGRPSGPGDPGPHGDIRYVAPGYFEALGIPLKTGRTFTTQDRPDTQQVAVIDEILARQYWPNEDPIGKHMRRGSRAPWATIVGIVAHVNHSNLAGDPGKGAYYYSMFQQPVPFATIVVKTHGDPMPFASAIREGVRSIDPNQPVHDVKSMQDLVARSLAPRLFVLRLLGFFAAAALLLASMGLYGVISYSVAQRTQEIGIRMALGAPRNSVLRLVIGQGLRLAGAGVLLGLLASAAGSRIIENQLFRGKAFDPLTFSLMAIVLLCAAFLASYLPARRATKVDPLDALRYE